MKCAPYVIVTIVILAVAVWAYWGWSRKETKPALAALTPFLMPIDDAFALQVQGKVVIVGKIIAGEVRPGDRLTVKLQNDEISVEVEALEAFGKPIAMGRSGENVGIMLIGVTKEQIRVGASLVR